MDKFINKIICGDCLKVMKGWPNKCVDLILTDLPYGQTSCSWDKRIDTVKLWAVFNRIIKDSGVVVLTAIQPFATELICNNLDNFKYDLIWDKGNTTGFLDAKKKPLRKHELILVFSKNTNGNYAYNPIKTKGKMRWKGGYHNPNNTDRCYGKKTKETKVLNDIYYPTSILNFGTVYRNDYQHPTQKPIELSKWLIQTYSNTANLVLDCCCGSGSFCVAAKMLGRRFIGIDISEDYCKIARERLEAVDTGVPVKETRKGQRALFEVSK